MVIRVKLLEVRSTLVNAGRKKKTLRAQNRGRILGHFVDQGPLHALELPWIYVACFIEYKHIFSVEHWSFSMPLLC